MGTLSWGKINKSYEDFCDRMDKGEKIPENELREFVEGMSREQLCECLRYARGSALAAGDGISCSPPGSNPHRILKNVFSERLALLFPQEEKAETEKAA